MLYFGGTGHSDLDDRDLLSSLTEVSIYGHGHNEKTTSLSRSRSMPYKFSSMVILVLQLGRQVLLIGEGASGGGLVCAAHCTLRTVAWSGAKLGLPALDSGAGALTLASAASAWQSPPRDLQAESHLAVTTQGAQVSLGKKWSR